MADVLDIHEGDDEFQVDEEGDSKFKNDIHHSQQSPAGPIHSLLLFD